jgi:RNA polymerase sigma-70 factor (ECF subfamily)
MERTRRSLTELAGVPAASTAGRAMSGRSGAGEQALLELAQSGDEGAFGDLIEAHRTELHAYCYRMLGSVHDAEDALQDGLLRAWRGLPGFEGTGSVRSWLYAIVANTALDLARRRARPELLTDGGAATAQRLARRDPLGPLDRLEPYPDGVLDGPLATSPEAQYELRESLELAFVVALQHMPPLQRAVLILRDVVGFSARETAGQLGTSVPAVTSALQRARAAAESRLPARSQQATLRELGDERIRALAGRYADAMRRGDADMLVSMLTTDATYTMPPPPTCLRSHAAIREFVRRDVSSQRWQHRPTRANGQLAIGCYILDADRGRYVASALDVLTLDGEQITAIRAFLTADLLRQLGYDGTFEAADFARFGLPVELAGNA